MICRRLGESIPRRPADRSICSFRQVLCTFPLLHAYLYRRAGIRAAAGPGPQSGRDRCIWIIEYVLYYKFCCGPRPALSRPFSIHYSPFPKRPLLCLPRSYRRRSGASDKTRISRYFDLSDGPNDAARNPPCNDESAFACDARCSEGFRLRWRLR